MKKGNTWKNQNWIIWNIKNKTFLGFLASAQGCKSAERWPISLHKGEGSTLKSYAAVYCYFIYFCILANIFT